MVWWWTKGFFFLPDCCAVCFGWWQDKPLILPVSLRLVGIPYFQTRCNVFLWGVHRLQQEGMTQMCAHDVWFFNSSIYSILNHSYQLDFPVESIDILLDYYWKYLLQWQAEMAMEFPPFATILNKKDSDFYLLWFCSSQNPGKISSRFQPLDTTASNYYFQVPMTRQNMKYSNNQVGPDAVAGELSDLRLNAPFSQKNEGVFLFQTLVQKKVRRLSSPTYLLWGIGKSRSLSYFLSCNLRPGRWRLTADATREEDGGGCAEGEGQYIDDPPERILVRVRDQSGCSQIWDGKISQHRSFDKC